MVTLIVNCGLEPSGNSNSLIPLSILNSSMPSIEVTFWMPSGSVSVSCWALTVVARKQSRAAQNNDFIQTENLVISNMSIQSVNG